MFDSPGVVFIVSRFPSRIQPWFANTAAQVIKRGGRISILGIYKGDEVYARVIDKYGMKDKASRVILPGYASFRDVVINFFPQVFNFSSVALKEIFSNPGRTYSSLAKRVAGILFLSPYLNRLKGFDVVHVHSEIVGYILIPLLKMSGLPVVLTYHGLTPSGVKGLSHNKRKELLSHVHLVLVNTEFAKRQYIGLGADPKKIKVIPQGTDLNKFTLRDNLEFACDGELLLLSVGRLSPDKGHEYTILAAKKLLDQGIAVRLKIVGQGEYLPEIIGCVSREGMSKHVEVITDISEEGLMEEYQRADIFVLSSIESDSGWQETQGVVIQEAQASGALVVATRSGGIPECIIDGTTGFLVNERSHIELANKIKWLIDNRRSWPKWRKSARRYVEMNYDIDEIGKVMMEIYEEAKQKK